MLPTTPSEWEALLALATPEERGEIEALLEADLARHIWRAQVGRQSEAADSEASVVGYGGAAGGGKSDLIAGLALTEHQRSCVFRREKVQTEGIIQRLTEILGGTDGYNSQKSVWRVSTGGVSRLIEFAGLDNPTDHQKWQGRPHDLKCVGAGTLIWMADGSRKPVERVTVGDLIWTLEGPKPVTRTIRSYKRAVRIVTPHGSQVQAFDHALLGPDGWSPRHSCASSPIRCHAAHRYGTSFATTFAALSTPRGNPAGDLLRRRGYAQGAALPRSWWATFADAARIGQEIVAEALSDLRQAAALLASPPHALEAGAPPRRCRAGFGSQGRSSWRGVRDVGAASSPQGLMARCSCELRHGGEQPRPCSKVGQAYPPRLADAGQQSPIYLLEGDGQQTPTRNRRMWSFPHPYGKGTRQTDHPVRVTSWRAEVLNERALFDLTVADANHYVAGAGFVNRNCYDEVTEQREAQVRFTMGWTRSNDPKQRCRVLMTFNPPTTAEGRWVIDFFGPWLDPRHPSPAKPGELRWYTTIKGGDVECAGPDRFVMFKGAPLYDFDPADFTPEKIITPRSRTFIPSRVTDNYFYVRSGYIETLQSLPEPLRSQMLDGDFHAGVEDDPWQIIPSAWIDAAMARWQPREKKEEMDSIGADIAAGGKDNMVIARRHGVWFDEPIRIPGVEIPQDRAGPIAASHILLARRDRAPLHVDVVGWGLSCVNFLTENEAQVVAVNFANGSDNRTLDGQLRFANYRADCIWRMRETLDPANPDPAALPPDPKLKADLASYRWQLRSNGIWVMPKKDQRELLGRSPDDGDAYCMANIATIKTEVYQAMVRRAKDYDRYKEIGF